MEMYVKDNIKSRDLCDQEYKITEPRGGDG